MTAMTAEAKKKSVRRNVGSVFALFFLINVVLVVLALVAAFAGKHPFTIFPEDTGSGVRLLVLASGAALSWAIGRWLYVQMLEGEFRPDDSATGATITSPRNSARTDTSSSCSHDDRGASESGTALSGALT